MALDYFTLLYHNINTLRDLGTAFSIQSVYPWVSITLRDLGSNFYIFATPRKLVSSKKVINPASWEVVTNVGFRRECWGECWATALTSVLRRKWRTFTTLCHQRRCWIHMSARCINPRVDTFSPLPRGRCYIEPSPVSLGRYSRELNMYRSDSTETFGVSVHLTAGPRIRRPKTRKVHWTCSWKPSSSKVLI